ncbi:MAG: class I SAM-dependent methyltransferase [Calditrichaeota bacterium]|nr:class I SAM-dependent methyltransferase [Calditrichota bacterium]
MESYFTRRKQTKTPDYEESYWGVVKDPDGIERDRLAEREKHLEDVKEELDFLNSLPIGRILDVGCGLGYLLSGLKSGWEKHGIEVSKFACEHASQFGNIHHGDLISRSYPDEHFDVVVMHHVIEHIDDPVREVKEIGRILKQGGHLLLGTPDFDSGCARRFGENYRLLHDKSHVSLFTNDSMHRFLRDHGFQINHVGYPFFETRYFTKENLERLFDTTKISPPFYGNFMTFYCQRFQHDSTNS